MLYFVDKEAIMNQKALHTLEYDKIIRLLIDKATSDPGRKMCENLQPGNSISQIDLRQEQTAAALDRLFKKGSWKMLRASKATVVWKRNIPTVFPLFLRNWSR